MVNSTLAEVSAVTGTEVQVPLYVILHVAFMCASFWILLPLGSLTAAYTGPHFVDGAKFFHIHWMSMTVATFLILAAFVCILYQTKSVSRGHGYFGCVVIVLFVLQFLYGALGRPALDHARRKKWTNIHKSIGSIAISLGLTNGCWGVWMYQDIYSANKFYFIPNILIVHAVIIIVYILSQGSLEARQRKKDIPIPVQTPVAARISELAE